MSILRRRDQCRSSLGTPSTRARFSAATRYRSQEDAELHNRNLPEMPAPFQTPPSKPANASTGLLGEGYNTDAQMAQTTPEGQPQEYIPPEQRDDPRLPRSVQAIYLKPLKRRAQYGVPTCDLQLRSYNVRNVEFFADFALRAAYYLHLPAAGPIPLPRITERWTVPRSNFIFKKSQENFERITLRRLIQIQDGHSETVEIWLAFLRKHAYYGVGMKANVWQHEKLGVGKTMDVSLENLKQAMEPKWAHFGRRKTLETSERAFEMMKSEAFQRTGIPLPSSA
ncbi:hypothetical protein HO173_000291 [Letharia columbiana]|uniref:Small ribosomal subunit protein uS10m n=1 Tax=Letharia columbiana TaxID=112416 RepID=A0A8H6G6U2_9LECA|nr:uncharacterized protein HO173_000291 [Letharia columbiana]KAF6241580.1 hypothetical protein HO173_000291 [Letharia columbiana]